MQIVIKEILGHLQDTDDTVTLFVEAELGGTVRETCQLTFTPEVTVQALIHALRLRRERAFSSSPS